MKTPKVELKEITVKDGTKRCQVKAPFHPDFPAGARKIGGKWNDGVKTWTFDTRDEERVRELCREVYGTDGTPTEVVTVHAKIQLYADGNRAFGLGRELAYRPGRDASVRMGEGVIVLGGDFGPSCGSMKHPRLCHDDPVTIEVRDVPRDLAESEAKAHPEDVRIVSTSKPVQQTKTPAETLLAVLKVTLEHYPDLFETLQAAVHPVLVQAAGRDRMTVSEGATNE